MAEYLHPGVYIEEKSFRSPPFEGVSTSTAGLVGRTRKGPEGKPTLVTSFAEFTRTFGDPFPVNAATPPQLGDYLGHAVRAFFDNGGKRAYIVRTLGQGALPSHVQVATGPVYRLAGSTSVRGPTTTIPLNTVRGLDSTSSLDVYSHAPDGTDTFRFNLPLTGVDVSRSTVSVNLPAGVTLPNGSTYFLDPLDSPAANAGPVFTARSNGKDGNALSVQIRPSESPAVKLVAQRFFKAAPMVASFSGVGTDVGPSSGATTMDLPALGVVDVGDTLHFADPNTEDAQITAIDLAPAVTVAATPASGPTQSSGMVTLTKRGGVTPAAAIPIYKLGAGEQVTLAGGNLTLPYGALALLHKDDEITIGGLSAKLTAEPSFATPTVGTADITITKNHPTTNVTIVKTGEIDAATHTKRLLVADTTGLATTVATPQPISITDGTNTFDATVVLVDGLKNTVLIQSTATIPDGWVSFELLQAAGASDTVAVASTSAFYVGGLVELFDGAAGQYFLVKSIDSGTRQVTLDGTPLPIVLPADPNARKAVMRTLEIDVLIYEGGVLAETFSGLTWNPDTTTEAGRRYLVDRLNDPDTGSQIVSVSWGSGPSSVDIDSQPTTEDGFPLALDGGDDGAPLAALDLIGQDHGPGARTGIEALKEKTDIALIAVPGVTDEEVQQALLNQCENLKYRFAILDGKPGVSDITQIEAHRGNYDSLYGGYYTPWLKTIDINTGATMLAPPSGYVLGICARVDNNRGVWKAPANEVVQNILDVELPFTDGEQDVLNPLGINLIRAFEGRGIRVWGARTTSSDAEWRYVNVRRLFIFLEHSIDNGTQWVVFEPNNEALWARVKEAIESFLFGVWKSGALMGTKPEEAYFVRCDRTTMTQDDIDNGRLVCLIGVAPAYPAEFVIFRIGQFTASTNQA